MQLGIFQKAWPWEGLKTHCQALARTPGTGLRSREVASLSSSQGRQKAREDSVQPESGAPRLLQAG